MAKPIPDAVKAAVSEYYGNFKGQVELTDEKEGVQRYEFVPDEELTIGFPRVFLYDGKNVSVQYLFDSVVEN